VALRRRCPRRRGILFGLLDLPEALPTLVLISILRTRPLLSKEPEAVPVDIALQRRETRLGVVRLMGFHRILVEFNRPAEMIQPGEDIPVQCQVQGRGLAALELRSISHLLHQKRSMNLVHVEGDGVAEPILQRLPIRRPVEHSIVGLLCGVGARQQIL